MTSLLDWLSGNFYTLSEWIASFLPACPAISDQVYDQISSVFGFMLLFSKFYPVDYTLYLLGVYMVMVIGIFTFKIIKFFATFVRG